MSDSRLHGLWAEAKRTGATQYVTGRPCKYGHVAPRQRFNGLCLACHRLKQAQRRKAQRGEVEPLAPTERRYDGAYRTIDLFGE